MPSPSSSLATLRPDLSAAFQEFDLEMQRRNYVASLVMPVVEVAKKVGTFGKIPVEQLLKKRDTRRAPGSGYNRSEFTYEAETFTCLEQGAEEPIDDDEAAMYAEYFDAEQISASRCMDDILRNAEARVGAIALAVSTTQAATAPWSTPATATPIDDVEAAVQAIFDNTGLVANSITIPWKGFRNLRNCDQIVERVKHQGFMDARAGAITRQQMATVFDLDFVFVAGAVTNTADEGQDATLSTVWDNTQAFVAKVATTEDPREPCFGRTFHWNETGSAYEGRVETYRDESCRSDIVRVRHDVDEVLLYDQAAARITGIA